MWIRHELILLTRCSLLLYWPYASFCLVFSSVLEQHRGAEGGAPPDLRVFCRVRGSLFPFQQTTSGTDHRVKVFEQQHTSVLHCISAVSCRRTLVTTIGEYNPIKCHQEVLSAQPMISPHLNVLTCFPPDWGMFSRR